MIGKTFLGRYEIQRLLGEGGMGRVYLARQTDLGRHVVVKVMHDHIAAEPKFRERFQRETLLMARFHHPYAVTLYDASLNDPAGPCIVMEYVKGGNLETLLEKARKMTPPRVCRILGQLCEVLQAAHDEGIIHRDLKPANLMVIDPDTPRERIKVMDFGLAKLIDEGTASKVTDTSVDFAVGTPAYIAPEQVRGENMDHRGDLYSVGVMAFELLAGRVPFQGNSGMDVLLAHATEEPPTFADIGLDGWVPKAMEAVIRKCMAKDPDKRHQSARELALDLNHALKQAKNDSRHRMKGVPTEEDDDDDIEMPIVNLEEFNDMQPVTTGGSGGMVAVAQRSGVTAAELTRAIQQDSQISKGMESSTWEERERSTTTLAMPFQMEAWMPESIALMKLRGFIKDNGGEVLESSPRLVRVVLHKAIGHGKWFNFSRRSGPLEFELQLHSTDPKRPNKLAIHVLFRPSHPTLMADKVWRERCTDVFVELRAYLMGGIVS